MTTCAYTPRCLSRSLSPTKSPLRRRVLAIRACMDRTSAHRVSTKRYHHDLPPSPVPWANNHASLAMEAAKCLRPSSSCEPQVRNSTSMTTFRRPVFIAAHTSAVPVGLYTLSGLADRWKTHIIGIQKFKHNPGAKFKFKRQRGLNHHLIYSIFPWQTMTYLLFCRYSNLQVCNGVAACYLARQKTWLRGRNQTTPV